MFLLWFLFFLTHLICKISHVENIIYFDTCKDETFKEQKKVKTWIINKGNIINKEEVWRNEKREEEVEFLKIEGI